MDRQSVSGMATDRIADMLCGMSHREVLTIALAVLMLLSGAEDIEALDDEQLMERAREEIARREGVQG